MNGKRLCFRETDVIEQLPDDVLILIISLLPNLAEIARTSVLSRRWRYLWRNISCLEFDATSILPKGQLYSSLDWYAAWVNSILNQVPAGGVKQLKLFYQLDNSHTNHIDQWINFAASNPLEHLHLEFSGYMRNVGVINQYKLSENTWLRAPLGLTNIKCLKSLFLSCVNVSQDFVCFIISNCPLLEDLALQMPGTCQHLDISGHPPSLPLRRLEILSSEGYVLTNLCAPRLTSLNFRSRKFDPLQIDVPMLTDLTICSGLYYEERLMQDLEHFRSYFPQLERLGLFIREPTSLRASQLTELVNLKYLKISFCSIFHSPFQQIISLIKACPLLETFSLTIWDCCRSYIDQRSEGWRKADKWCEKLKTLELSGDKGKILDEEIVKFIIRKAPQLKKLTVKVYLNPGLKEYCSFLYPVSPSLLQALEKKAKKLCRRSRNEIAIEIVA